MQLHGDRLRRYVRTAHLWLGLSLGALFALLGLTGSVLAFYPELDAMLHPEIRMEGEVAPDWDRALATLRSSYPDKDGPWRIEVTGGGAIPARYYNPPERAGYAFRPMMAWLSPDGSRVLRRDYWGEYAMTFIYDLHFRLLLGEGGGAFLGWAGFGLLALLLSGIWAWWPRGTWRKALRLKLRAPAQRSLRDWHKLAGLTGLPLLVMLTVTGIMLELPDESDAALNAAGLRVDRPPAVRSSTFGDAVRPQITPAQAVNVAQAALPQARLAWIETPSASGGLYRLRMQVQGDPSARFPHSFVWVDAGSGRVVAVQNARRASSGTVVNNWVHSLHDGSAAGLSGRVIVALSGLLPLALFVTGLWRWAVRNRKSVEVASG